MKQQLIPQQKLDIKQKFNHQVQNSLNILSFNNEELKIYLQEQMNTMPFLNFAKEPEIENFLNYNQHQESLYDKLMEQIPYVQPPLNQDICDFLIFQLDSNGYFRQSETELLQSSPFTKLQTLSTLHALQTLEPYGCFAFNLAHCLQLQCIRHSSIVSQNATILCNYLEDIIKQKYAYIESKTSLCKEDILEAFKFIQTLNPKPAANYANFAPYAQPEFKISINADRHIQIESNHSDLELVFDVQNEFEGKEFQEFVKKQRASANSLIQAIQKRNTTLLQIMQIICEKQKDFFLNDGCLQPLTLEMVAKECGLHISTISRAIMNKSFEFNHRYYLLKTMFKRSGIHSSETFIKQRIHYYIDHEDKQNPYSDEKLRKLLLSENIKVARRTISKYREDELLSCSNERKIKV